MSVLLIDLTLRIASVLPIDLTLRIASVLLIDLTLRIASVLPIDLTLRIASVLLIYKLICNTVYYKYLSTCPQGVMFDNMSSVIGMWK